MCWFSRGTIGLPVYTISQKKMMQFFSVHVLKDANLPRFQAWYYDVKHSMESSEN